MITAAQLIYSAFSPCLQRMALPVNPGDYVPCVSAVGVLHASNAYRVLMGERAPPGLFPDRRQIAPNEPAIDANTVRMGRLFLLLKERQGVVPDPHNPGNNLFELFRFDIDDEVITDLIKKMEFSLKPGTVLPDHFEVRSHAAQPFAASHRQVYPLEFDAMGPWGALDINTASDLLAAPGVWRKRRPPPRWYASRTSEKGDPEGILLGHSRADQPTPVTSRCFLEGKTTMTSMIDVITSRSPLIIYLQQTTGKVFVPGIHVAASKRLIQLATEFHVARSSHGV